MSKVINITDNGKSASTQIKKRLKRKLLDVGFDVSEKFDQNAQLLICVGGDGALLNALKEYDFPNMPVVGINTGHLGFFQELDKTDIDEFLFKYQMGDYKVQEYTPVEAKIICRKDNSSNNNQEETVIKGLNEIIIKGAKSHATHLNIFIGDSFVEQFIGDGIVVSTVAGSTAYNYALGGSIIDPRLNTLQVTPIAPINSAAYRSFTSSILLPPDLSLKVFPEYARTEEIVIARDGSQELYDNVKEVHVGLAKEKVRLLRFKDYDFWNTVKTKLL